MRRLCLPLSSALGGKMSHYPTVKKSLAIVTSLFLATFASIVAYIAAITVFKSWGAGALREVILAAVTTALYLLAACVLIKNSSAAVGCETTNMVHCLKFALLCVITLIVGLCALLPWVAVY
jgi:hypothetical protein